MDTTKIEEIEYSKGSKGISGFTLKMIAIITMFIDHFAATILERPLLDYTLWITEDNRFTWAVVYAILRGIGRMAFPIYCFLLVEGFTYTRNRLKYAGRLLLFCFISEVPFDMAFKRSFFDMSYNNVFFTLFLGLVTMILLDKTQVIKELMGESQSKGRWFAVNFIRCVCMIGIIFATAVIAEYVLHVDYGAAGVLAITVLYLLRNYRMIGFAASIVLLGLMASPLEFAALLMLWPIYFYNGTRGKQVKYFFYVFYPAHLLILSLVCYFLGLGI